MRIGAHDDVFPADQPSRSGLDSVSKADCAQIVDFQTILSKNSFSQDGNDLSRVSRQASVQSGKT
jgi:hypothetical protein